CRTRWGAGAAVSEAAEPGARGGGVGGGVLPVILAGSVVVRRLLRRHRPQVASEVVVLGLVGLGGAVGGCRGSAAREGPGRAARGGGWGRRRRGPGWQRAPRGAAWGR